MHLEPFDWERFAELFSRALLFVLFVMPFSPKLTNMDVAAQAADHRIFPVSPMVMFAATPYPNGVLRDRAAQAEGGPHSGAVDSVRGR